MNDVTMQCNLMTRQKHLQYNGPFSPYLMSWSALSRRKTSTLWSPLTPRHSIHAHSINSCSADCNCRYGAHGEPYASGRLRVHTDHENPPRNFVPGNATWPQPSEPDETRFKNRGVPGILARMYSYHVNRGVDDKSLYINSRDGVDQPCPTRRPPCTFLAPSVSTLFQPIININSNSKTKKLS
jgi:hypothetical protein